MSTEEGVVATYHLDLNFDHNQFFLEDCERKLWTDDEIDALYDEAAEARHLGVIPGCLSILVARLYGVLGLEVVVRDGPPDDDLAEWDNVAEASIELRSGCLVASGPETYEHGSRITVPPGTYRVRVYTGASTRWTSTGKRGMTTIASCSGPRRISRPHYSERMAILDGRLLPAPVDAAPPAC